MSAKDVSVKFLQEPFKMPEMHILCNHQPVNLVELRLMSRIGRLVAEYAPGRDDAEGRLMFFKIMRVNRCGVRAQERFTLRSFMRRRGNRLLKIKSILHCSRWMVGRNVECVKIIALALYLGTLCNRKTELPKVTLGSIDNLGKRV